MDNQRALGRPRDAAATPAILAAARRLVLASGFGDVSIGMIACEAGVGRQTLYRRWAGKAELILDAFFDSASSMDDPGGGPVETVLTSYFMNLFENLQTDGPAIRSLIASAQTDAVFRKVFENRFVAPRADIVLSLLQAAVQKGEIRRDADLAMAIDVLHGAMWYRLLRDETLDADYSRRLASLVMCAVR